MTWVGGTLKTVAIRVRQGSFQEIAVEGIPGETKPHLEKTFFCDSSSWRFGSSRFETKVSVGGLMSNGVRLKCQLEKCKKDDFPSWGLVARCVGKVFVCV